MAKPFQVYDYQKQSFHGGCGHIWCIRCADWIPLSEAFGLYCDPHVADHIAAYHAMKSVDATRGRLN